jgi:hypothetical protein
VKLAFRQVNGKGGITMSTQEIRVSDLSGQRIENLDEQLVRIVVTEHPDLEPDKRVPLDALPDELENVGRWSIAAVGLEITFPGDETPTRHVLTKANFDKLATNRPMDEVLASAAVIKAVKERRSSHNTTRDGAPLVNYNEPENAGLPHKGKTGDQEAAYVRDNLELVNERRIAAGHKAIDPTNPLDAKRYGFPMPDQS